MQLFLVPFEIFFSLILLLSIFYSFNLFNSYWDSPVTNNRYDEIFNYFYYIRCKLKKSFFFRNIFVICKSLEKKEVVDYRFRENGLIEIDFHWADILRMGTNMKNVKKIMRLPHVLRKFAIT